MKNKDKLLITSMWILLLSNLIFFFATIYLVTKYMEEDLTFSIFIITATFIFVSVAFFALKIDVETGCYECKNCHHKYSPKYIEALFSPHIFTTRYLKCPKCHERQLLKKII